MRVYTRTKKKGKKEYRCRRCGKTIQPGERYYSYKPRNVGPVYHCSAHYPKQSEMTKGKMSMVFAAQEDAEERLNALTVGEVTEDWDGSDILSEVSSILEDFAEAIREVASEYQESADAMEDGFGHETYVSQEVREKGEELEAWADEIESDSEPIVTFDPPERDEDEDEDVYQDALDEAAEDFLSECRDHADNHINNCPI